MRKAAAVVTALGIAFAGVGALPGAASAADVGQWNYNTATGHYYRQVDTMTWAQAEAYAVAVGGHLVTINNQAEQDWLMVTFTEPEWLPNEHPFWIGLNDRAQEGTWVWPSGELVTYENWNPAEPNNCGSGIPDASECQEEDAVVMNFTSGGYPEAGPGWNDLPEDGLLGGIVEVTSPPTQPTFWVGLDCDCFDIVGGGWPDDYPVTVTAHDPESGGPDISVSLATDADGAFYGNVLPGVSPGWFIIVTDGVTTKTHTVANVSITFVDPATDTMRGTADPGTNIVYAGGVGYAQGEYTYADGSGQWFVDVTAVHDITIGSEVGASQTDGDGDFTYTIQVVPALDELLGDMVADGRLPSQGVATSIMNQTEKAPLKALTNHLSDLVRRGVISQQTMDQILGTVVG